MGNTWLIQIQPSNVGCFSSVSVRVRKGQQIKPLNTKTRLFVFSAGMLEGLDCPFSSKDHDKMVGEHSFLQPEMRREVLQQESMPSNKPQKPLTSLQIELWRYILRELMGKVSERVSSVKSALLILVQGGNGIKQAKTHSMERTQDTKVKQSFNSPATCFL